MCHHMALCVHENGNTAYWSGSKKTRLPSRGFFSASTSLDCSVSGRSVQRQGKSSVIVRTRARVCVCVCTSLLTFVLNIAIVALNVLHDAYTHE
jgi:hypothetical protein